MGGRKKLAALIRRLQHSYQEIDPILKGVARKLNQKKK